MEVFAEFLDHIENPQHRERMEEVLSWVMKKFPSLSPTLKWNQPMFTDHGTYIIGFSISKKHMAVSPEQTGVAHFSDEISKVGYDQTKEIVRIPWDRPVEYSLLEKMIEFNMMDKATCTTFWR
ncbi:iron chaperone [Paenibacillus sp. FSL W8-0186]|uniref:Intracellular iron chaperone frataxin n=1 Tax=Paenibacillus woosongensis TaxID=307580 RepID=A0ABQ4MSU0_9BACL|nr:iron chaperone [Paenibacillus woosongensis]GIP59046.1 intracellular iron chaperone frataxin [Paenibacillus woosongensis]